MAFYVVIRGRTPGIYGSWMECSQQVHGLSGVVFKKYGTLEEATNALASFHSLSCGLRCAIYISHVLFRNKLHFDTNTNDRSTMCLSFY